MTVPSRRTEWQVMKRKGGKYSAVEVPVGFDPVHDEYEVAVNQEPSHSTHEQAQAIVDRKNGEARAEVKASILEAEND